MPLHFDPASIMAPGGIASGLDDLGAAVVNAMNRRAERRYATEREERQRGFQREEREAGQQFQEGQAKFRAGEDWKQQQRAADTGLIEEMRKYTGRVQTGTRKSTDPETGAETQEPVFRGHTPEEREQWIAGMDARIAAHRAQFGETEAVQQWEQYKSRLATPPTTDPLPNDWERQQRDRAQARAADISSALADPATAPATAAMAASRLAPDVAAPGGSTEFGGIDTANPFRRLRWAPWTTVSDVTGVRPSFHWPWEDDEPVNANTPAAGSTAMRAAAELTAASKAAQARTPMPPRNRPITLRTPDGREGTTTPPIQPPAPTAPTTAPATPPAATDPVLGQVEALIQRLPADRAKKARAALARGIPPANVLQALQAPVSP